MPNHLTRRHFLAAAALLPTLSHGQAPPPRTGGELLIGGTGAGLGPLQRVVDEQGLRNLRLVPSLGTNGGLRALAAGAIDLALSARRLADDERARGLVEQELFRTPVVWAVHDGVPLRHATLDELAALYAARTTTWANGTPVRLVLRPDSDSDTALIKSASPAMAEAVAAAQARPGVQMGITDIDAIEAIERIPGALGVTTLGLVRAQRRRVQVLTLAGTTPGLDTLAAGRWPLAKRVYLVSRGTPAGVLADAVQALNGRPAAQLLTALGCRAGAAA